MNYPRLVSAAIAALIVFFAWGFLTEGWLLMNMNVKLGLEITTTNAIGWVLAGFVIGLVYKPPIP